MTKPGMRYCTYCRCNRPEADFIDIRDKTGKRRNRKCSYCVGIGQKPKEFRDERGKRLAEQRRNSDSVKQQALKNARLDQQREKELQKSYESKATGE